MQIAFQTDSGTRKENQDYVGSYTNTKGYVMAIVADGVTSNEGGEVASSMAVEHFGYEWQQTKIDTIKLATVWLKKMVKKENDTILSAGDRFSELQNMATTIVLAIFFEKKVLIGNLGDSKAFLLHNNHLKQVSCDHNLKNELFRAGTVSHENAENVPSANSVTRYLGVDKHADIEIEQYNFVADDILFLTSDGITKVLTLDMIATILQEKLDLKMRVEKLINEANAKNVSDNITALLVGRGDEKDSE
ncbi:protein phosphatase 2C domain-containing protein [Leuconostoc palmae]|uniref:protein phosphatase 2C domain-containing protein n=1 Tax=Leuconostoc palmae TaxID=501487 RepID=UPI001C7D5DA1|nr:protein phosphatase 2C domain-containing protein [Leuconostoc palmae]